ncbi:Uncharacterised protein [Mycobacterium tuberculosis]|nr:Uncharacterised protein [Mycobacterium tuberculosis]
MRKCSAAVTHADESTVTSPSSTSSHPALWNSDWMPSVADAVPACVPNARPVIPSFSLTAVAASASSSTDVGISTPASSSRSAR